MTEAQQQEVIRHYLTAPPPPTPAPSRVSIHQPFGTHSEVEALTVATSMLKLDWRNPGLTKVCGRLPWDLAQRPHRRQQLKAATRDRSLDM